MTKDKFYRMMSTKNSILAIDKKELRPADVEPF